MVVLSVVKDLTDSMRLTVKRSQANVEVRKQKVVLKTLELGLRVQASPYMAAINAP